MDNIDEFKLQVKDPRKTYFVILIIILTAAAAFGLGRLSKIEEGRVPIEFSQWNNGRDEQVAGVSDTKESTAATAASPSEALAKEGRYVGSRNSDKYHFPWCPGAQRISENNKVWFASKEEAEKAGYVPAANCRGL